MSINRPDDFNIAFIFTRCKSSTVYYSNIIHINISIFDQVCIDIIYLEVCTYDKLFLKVYMHIKIDL